MRELLCSNALTPRDDKEKVSKYSPIYEVDQSNFRLVEHGDWDILLCYGKEDVKAWGKDVEGRASK